MGGDSFVWVLDKVEVWVAKWDEDENVVVDTVGGAYFSAGHVSAKFLENEISLMFADFPTVKAGCHSDVIDTSSILDLMLDGKIDYILTL